MNYYFLFLGGLIAPSMAMYAGTNVVELDPKNFQKEVIKSDSVWIVEFYAPWCGHCQRLVPDYTKAAKALKGVVKVRFLKDVKGNLCNRIYEGRSSEC